MKVISIAILCFTIGYSYAQSGSFQAQGSVSTGSGTASGSYSGQLPSASILTRPVYSALQAGQHAINGAVTAGRETFQQMLSNGAQVASVGIDSGKNFMNSIRNSKVAGVQTGVSAAQGAMGSTAGAMSAIPVFEGIASQKMSMASDMIGQGGQAAQKALAKLNQLDSAKLSLKHEGVNDAFNAATTLGDNGFAMTQKFADKKFATTNQEVAAMKEKLGAGLKVAETVMSAGAAGAEMAGAAMIAGGHMAGAAMNAGGQMGGAAMNLGGKMAGAAMNAGRKMASAAMNTGAQAAAVGAQMAGAAMNAGTQAAAAGNQMAGAAMNAGTQAEAAGNQMFGAAMNAGTQAAETGARLVGSMQSSLQGGLQAAGSTAGSGPSSGFSASGQVSAGNSGVSGSGSHFSRFG